MNSKRNGLYAVYFQIAGIRENSQPGKYAVDDGVIFKT